MEAASRTRLGLPFNLEAFVAFSKRVCRRTSTECIQFDLNKSVISTFAYKVEICRIRLSNWTITGSAGFYRHSCGIVRITFRFRREDFVCYLPDMFQWRIFLMLSFPIIIAQLTELIDFWSLFNIALQSSQKKGGWVCFFLSLSLYLLCTAKNIRVVTALILFSFMISTASIWHQTDFPAFQLLVSCKLCRSSPLVDLKVSALEKQFKTTLENNFSRANVSDQDEQRGEWEHSFLLIIYIFITVFLSTAVYLPKRP